MSRINIVQSSKSRSRSRSSLLLAPPGREMTRSKTASSDSTSSSGGRDGILCSEVATAAAPAPVPSNRTDDPPPPPKTTPCCCCCCCDGDRVAASIIACMFRLRSSSLCSAASTNFFKRCASTSMISQGRFCPEDVDAPLARLRTRFLLLSAVVGLLASSSSSSSSSLFFSPPSRAAAATLYPSWRSRMFTIPASRSLLSLALPTPGIRRNSVLSVICDSFQTFRSW
mmetsp:Transcript_7188/g.16389  ORF Transcript_7188/g.16389 Transcript_7188/m.16389 type:complete len:227 (-) Transcript_7188:1159-1839(-)